MEAFATSLIIVILLLVLLQYILDAVKLEERARNIIWLIALFGGIIWLLKGFIL